MRKIFGIIILGIVLLSSCTEEFLDRAPEQSVATEDAIVDVNSAQVALNGVYDELQAISLYARDYMIISDLATDNTRMRAENSGRFLNVYDWNLTEQSGYMSGPWNQAYDVINRANNVILKTPQIEIGDSAAKAQIVGEALMIRALTHFNLVNFFGQPYQYTTDASHLGVPILTEPAPVDYNPSRNTVAEVYTQVITDLEDAYDMMSASSNAFYCSKYGAAALLSRVYLYMGDWTNAKAYAEEVIKDGSCCLLPEESYIAGWSEESTSESIFSIKFTETDNYSVDMLGYMYLNSGYGDVIPTQDIMDIYDDKDIRNEWFYLGADENIHIQKYPQGRTDNTPVLRLSEMYLNLAEAEYQLGNPEAARTALNMIRERAGLNPETGATGGILRGFIYDERRRELAFEGHHLWDLQRTSRDIVRDDVTKPSDPKVIEYGSHYYAYPIPRRELNVNPNIEQNPGW